MEALKESQSLSELAMKYELAPTRISNLFFKPGSSAGCPALALPASCSFAIMRLVFSG